jgi:hypothetical protein
VERTGIAGLGSPYSKFFQGFFFVSAAKKMRMKCRRGKVMMEEGFQPVGLGTDFERRYLFVINSSQPDLDFFSAR